MGIRKPRSWHACVYVVKHCHGEENERTLHRDILFSLSWASYQIRKIAGCACTGNTGNVFPARVGSDPVMHHGTCVTHVPWCMPGSLTSDFLLIRQREKRSRHSRCICNPQFCVSGKRPISFGRWHSVGRGIKICLDWIRKLMMKPNHRRIQDVTVFQANKFAKQVFQLTPIPIRIILLSLVSIQWSFPWENTTSRAESHGSQGEDLWESGRCLTSSFDGHNIINKPSSVRMPGPKLLYIYIYIYIYIIVLDPAFQRLRVC